MTLKFALFAGRLAGAGGSFRPTEMEARCERRLSQQRHTRVTRYKKTIKPPVTAGVRSEDHNPNLSVQVVGLGRIFRAPHPGAGSSRCGPQRYPVATIAPMAPGTPKISSYRGPDTIANCHAGVLHHRSVAIAIDHARSAAITNALGSVEFPYVAERAVPVMAAPKLQVPIEIERFPSR